MANSIIEDGGGSGKKAKVTTDNLLKVAARTETQVDHEVELGNAYNANTGTINLTAAGSSGLLYLKNLGDDPIVVPAGIYLLGTTDGTFGEWLLEMIRNPTGGTLISTATALTPINRNFGSNNTLNATCYKGSYGLTVTGGDVVVESLVPSSGRFAIAVQVELPKGTSLALRVTPPAGNTDADVQVAMAPYVRTVDA